MSRLADEIRSAQERALRQRVFNAVLAENATIAPEGKIENMHAERERVSVGSGSYLRGRLFVYGHGGRITIGDWCYVGVRSEIWSMDSVTIGNRVLIAHDVNIHDGTAHSMDPNERHEHFKNIILGGHPKTWEELPGVCAAPITIEDDVWISFGVTILKGVRIGARSVIAAGSIVTHDVPADSFYRCEITPVINSIKRGESRQC